MNDNLIIKQKDLIENPTPRVAVCLVLDCSPSMSGEVNYGSIIQQTNQRPIDALNEGVRCFFTAVKEDEIAKYSVEIAVVSFSGKAKIVLDFQSIENVDIPTLELDMEHGGTSIGTAVKLTLELLNKRKNEYKEAGVDYYQPWLVLMTDGQPTDDTHKDVSKTVRELINTEKLTIFPIAIGDGADMEVLSMFSPKRTPLKLKGLKFNDFFEWLSQSISPIPQSIPGEVIPLNKDGIKGWTEL